MQYKHSNLTNQIINCFYAVYRNLGYGFLEKVYERSLAIELRKNGLSCQTQIPIKVSYYNEQVGDYYADLLVNDLVIIELKAQDFIVPENEAQLLNYLKATDYEIGLLLNFGKKPEIKREIFDNELK